MFRYALKLAYRGTRYCGWQIQLKQKSGQEPSLQECVQGALLQMTQTPINVMASGRTDSGVHASGQVAHFDCEKSWDPTKLQNGLNSLLPKDIRVLSVYEVPRDFHSQRSALKKQYSYYFLQGPCDFPSLYATSYWIRKKLNLSQMQEAAKDLLGQHDFKPFQASGSNVKTTQREIFEIEVGLQEVSFPEQKGFHLIRLRIVGSGFLKQMVRGVAGTLLEIGEERKPVHLIQTILECQDRSLLGSTAPSRGLWLEKVWYPDEFQID